MVVGEYKSLIEGVGGKNDELSNENKVSSQRRGGDFDDAGDVRRDRAFGRDC